MKNSKYQCCFCGKKIEFNITALLLITNYDKDLDEQQEQQFFCHINCFKKKLNRNIPLYLLDLEK